MSLNSILAVRGAITLTENSKAEIETKTTQLIKEMIEKNGVGNICRAVSLIISSTKDITAFYPAAAVRESGLIKDCPLFSAEEPAIENSLNLCVRMMLTIASNNENAKANHVYLGGAAALRPDLVKDKVFGG